jgi:mRNA-degrading endonuclease RelE of RelBE toxin-antitoxin system
VGAKTSKNWIVKVSSQAEGYLKRLAPAIKKQIIEHLNQRCHLENPLDHGDVRPLVGPLQGSYRLRVGGHRIIFDLFWEEEIIAVGAIKPCGDAYK